ncbi:MAG TPA: ATP-binding protein [Pirellulales bacterium]|jgi:signal transduction histidine kinase|nr:ATP-binding protein [Pirellulales bacterium]
MRRPWQIGLVFISGLAIAFAALGWLSIKALDLEQEREQGRLDAELEEDVRQALWHADSLVMPILAQESAWPTFAYQPSYPSGRSKGTEPLPSPLLTPTNDLVLLNFQIEPDKRIVSPQVPSDKLRSWAVKNGSSAELIDESKSRLAEMRLFCEPDRLIEKLPPEQPIALALPPQVNPNSVLSQMNSYFGSTGVQNSGQQAGVPLSGNGPPNGNEANQANPPILYSPQTVSGANSLPATNGPSSITATAGTSGNPVMLAVQPAPTEPNAARPSQTPLANNGNPALVNPLPPIPKRNSAYGNAPPNLPAVDATSNGTGPLQNGNAQNEYQQPAELNQAVEGSGNFQTANQPAYAQSDNGRNRNDNRDQEVKNSLDWAYRSRAYTQYGQNLAQQQQRFNWKQGPSPAANSELNLHEGLGKAVWLESALVFARRVTLDDKVLVQGCWLDWSKLSAWLTNEVRATLPEASLVPVKAPDEEVRGRMLATLPVKLLVPPVTFVPATWYTPIRISLLVAWGCMLLGATAVGVLLFGVVTLSERRGAFVSAVTHELRTPLTTFRMYAEMLSEGMVQEPAQQKHYLDTLRSEADRLTHLVGNVLAYARLERGKLSDRLKTAPLAELIGRCRERLFERAQGAQLELLVELDDATAAQPVRADSAAVEQILFNLVDNASKYAASATDRRLHLTAACDGRWVRLCLRDHGPGVSAKEAKRLFQPFRKSAKDAANSAPGVGLGLALCRRLARDLGGELTSEEHGSEGACFVLKLVAAR